MKGTSNEERTLVKARIYKTPQWELSTQSFKLEVQILNEKDYYNFLTALFYFNYYSPHAYHLYFHIFFFSLFSRKRNLEKNFHSSGFLTQINRLSFDGFFSGNSSINAVYFCKCQFQF